MKGSVKTGTAILLLMLLTLPLLVACGGDDGEGNASVATTSAATPKPTTTSGEPAKKVTLTIGNISDLTGPASVALVVVNSILDDLLKWSNEENFVPGVELKALHYDGQYDPSRDIPAYEWLKDKGADIFLTGLPNVPVSLQTRVNDDKNVLMCLAMDSPQANPPGYEFAINMAIESIVNISLKWIADNDWDWKTKGPAKIGVVSWDTTYYRAEGEAIKRYAKTHPEQVKWNGANLSAPGSFKWDDQVEATKNFDYLLPPAAPIASFAKQYYEAGGKAKLVMCDAQISYFGLIGDAKLWPNLDGSLVFLPCPWWDEETKIVSLTKELLVERGGDAALKKAMEREHGYLTTAHMLYGLLLMIKQTVERVGPDNFSPQALYDTLTSGFTVDYGEEYAPWGYNPATDRFGYGSLLAYRVNGSTGGIIKAETGWLPIPAE